MSDTTLLLGGARSGKTARALELASQSASQAASRVPSQVPSQVAGQPSGELIYIATAEARDDEMTARIARHRAERGPRWRTIESPLALAETLSANSLPESVIVVDCLTLWLSNILLADRDVEAETRALCEAIEQSPAQLILVSNEVGLGIVPVTALGRGFRDCQGRLNQRIAAIAGNVEFIAAGIPLRLKPQ